MKATLTLLFLAVALVGCKSGQHKYDLNPAVAAAGEKLDAARLASLSGSIGLRVTSESDAPNAIGYTHRMNHLQVRGVPVPPVTVAVADKPCAEYVTDATADLIEAKGLSVDPDNPRLPRFEVSITRFEATPPDPNLFDGKRRPAFLEGMVSIVKDGEEVYQRRIAVQAEREFGKASEALGWVQGDVMVISHNKEEDEGVQSLFAELFSKYQIQLLEDADLWNAIDRSTVADHR